MAHVLGTPHVPADLAQNIRNTMIREALRANSHYMVWENIVTRRDALTVGANVEIPKNGAIAVDGATLPTNDDPTPATLTESNATIAVAEKGKHAIISRETIRQKDMDTIKDKSQVLADHMAQTIDYLGGTAAVASANILYVAGKTGVNDLDDATDVMSANDFIRAVAWLERDDKLAPKFADGTYAAVLHSAVMADLFANGTAVTGFVDKVRYAQPEAFRTGEMGQFHGCTIFKASQKTRTALGANTGASDLFESVFCGAGFLGRANAVEPDMHGPAPLGDAMERFFKLWWYGVLGYGIVKAENGLKYRSRSAYAPTP